MHVREAGRSNYEIETGSFMDRLLYANVLLEIKECHCYTMTYLFPKSREQKEKNMYTRQHHFNIFPQFTREIYKSTK